MITKDILKAEIDRVDDNYLELLFKIISQFPYLLSKSEPLPINKRRSDILKDIAQNGGLGISDPIEWQRDIRQDRKLPFIRHFL